MGFVRLLRFYIKHFVLLAWPFCALGYPLCASVRAIETKSEEEALNLISYWISFSAILLFEHAFEKLLEWLAFWCYVKLVIVVCLVVNDFSGSLYVYNHLFQPCLSLNLQTLVHWFNKAKKSFSKKDTFLVELEKYVNENGADALQNLLVAKGVNLNHASKEIKTLIFEHAKVSASPSVDMLHSQGLHNHTRTAELSSTKFEGLKVGSEDIDTVQMTENGQATSTMLVKEVEFKLQAAEKSEFSPPDVKEVQAISDVVSQIPKKILPQTVQKQWTCALCQVVTTSEGDLASHLRGRRHKEAREELKVNSLARKTTQLSPASIETKSSATPSPVVIDKQQKPDNLKSDGIDAKDSPWQCVICNIKCTGKINLVAHLNGKKHLAAVQNSITSHQLRSNGTTSIYSQI